MPLYEYRCSECGVVFEESRTMAEANAPVACPDGHGPARRLISAFAAVSSAGSDAAPRSGPCGSACACYPG